MDFNQILEQLNKDSDYEIISISNQIERLKRLGKEELIKLKIQEIKKSISEE